jgi:hypothetical protein
MKQRGAISCHYSGKMNKEKGTDLFFLMRSGLAMVSFMPSSGGCQE